MNKAVGQLMNVISDESASGQEALYCSVGQSITLESGVVITVLRISNGVVKLGITAPLHVRVRAGETCRCKQPCLES